ncbi:MAG: amino acid ABC transporter permease [Alphaproteobacteria bacterium]|nr:amino acid ABC transporter permease [Alphaproteobacteria bacterium]
MSRPPSPRPFPVLLPVRPPAAIAARWGDCRTATILALASAPLLLMGEALAAPGEAGIVATLWKWTPVMASGFVLNLWISVLAMAIGTASGAVLGLMQVSLLAPVRGGSWLVTQFFRNAPWLVLLFYCILLMPFEIRLGGVVIPLPAWIKAVVGLALPVMANVAEVVRGAIQSIPTGQWDGAKALGLTRLQTMGLVILPQCLKRMLPPWMNVYAILTMATPLVSIVGVQEAMNLTRAALNAESRPDLLIPMYLYLLVWFFLYCFPIARATLWLERRYGVAG